MNFDELYIKSQYIFLLLIISICQIIFYISYIYYVFTLEHITRDSFITILIGTYGLFVHCLSGHKTHLCMLFVTLYWFLITLQGVSLVQAIIYLWSIYSISIFQKISDLRKQILKFKV